jgi:hypothetical protein
MTLTPYQQFLLDAQATLRQGLLAKGFRLETVRLLVTHHAAIRELLVAYQEALCAAYQAQQAAEGLDGSPR